MDHCSFRENSKIPTRPNGTKMLTLTFIAITGAGVAVSLWYWFGPQPTLRHDKVADLKMTVTGYRYSSETKELIANVQLVNNGPMRRIVMGAMFTYKPPGQERDQNTRHYIIESMEELGSQGDLQTPLYVEPGQPIVATFRHKVVDETPLNTPGTVFGIEINSLTAAGVRNTTWVDVMEAAGDVNDPAKVIGHVTGRKETISLDEPWGNNPMEAHSQLRRQLEAKPIPSTALAIPSGPTAPHEPIEHKKELCNSAAS